MTDKTNTLRRATALGLAGAMALAGTAGAAPTTPKPWREVLWIQGPDANNRTQLGVELQASADLGNKYLDSYQDNRSWDVGTGAFMLLAGFYGAAVTAFNPAPKNLKAAILASGTGAGLNTGLKFRDRSLAYRQGHHAMSCLVETGAPMLTYDRTALDDLRADAARALALADLALIGDAARKAGRQADAEAAAANAPPEKVVVARIDLLLVHLASQADDVERKALQERMKVLSTLDGVLAVEEGAYAGAPQRVAQVRRQIQDATDKALDGAAPDYAAAVKAIGETAKPEAGPSGTPPGAPTPNEVTMSMMEGRALPQTPSIDTALIAVNAVIRRLEAGSPAQATAAHKAMGECIPKAG